MPEGKEPKFTKSGEPDGRGHGEGSKATRFTKDDGRKRPGRRTGSRDLKTIVKRVRDLPVGTEKNGRRGPNVDTQEGILRVVRKKALSGDIKAAAFLQNQFDRFEVPSVDPNEVARRLEEDADILAAAMKRGLLPSRGDGEKS